MRVKVPPLVRVGCRGQCEAAVPPGPPQAMHHAHEVGVEQAEEHPAPAQHLDVQQHPQCGGGSQVRAALRRASGGRRAEASVAGQTGAGGSHAQSQEQLLRDTQRRGAVVARWK